MTGTTTSSRQGLDPQIDIVLLAKALGYQTLESHPKSPWPVSQCPACLSKPRRPGHDCKPNGKLTVVLIRRSHGTDMWACQACLFGWGVDEFVAFHLFAKRHHQLSAKKKRAISAFLHSLEGIHRPAPYRPVAGCSP